jgi:shikimate dehydrogenase
MIRAAVLGSPISHSLSPVLHNRAYEILGVHGRYEAIDLTPERALEFFAHSLLEDWTGFSLTMPLKELIFDLGGNSEFEIDPIALQMRSANTLFKSNGVFRATSTDRSAFVRLFAEVEKGRVAIVGGGGTARAALSALDGAAKSIDFLLRTPARAQLLRTIASKSDLKFFDMEHSLHGYDLVITTVPSGASDSLARKVDFTIPTFCEVLYKPFPTPFLARAKELGSRTIDGIDLLVEQALDQIALFSEMEFAYDQMRSALQTVARENLDG